MVSVHPNVMVVITKEMAHLLIFCYCLPVIKFVECMKKSKKNTALLGEYSNSMLHYDFLDNITMHFFPPLIAHNVVDRLCLSIPIRQVLAIFWLYCTVKGALG